MEVSSIEHKMIKLIIFVLCSSPASIYATKCNLSDFDWGNIKRASKAIPKAGEYSIDWAAAAIPEGAGVCVKSVIIFYKCQNKTHCFAHSKTKRPSRDKDVSPFILPICADDPNDYPDFLRYAGIYLTVEETNKQ